jgi:hypothetical protein
MPTCPVDAEIITKLAEMDMLVADLERANSRVAAVERRNVRLFPFLTRFDINLRIGIATGGNRGCTDW